MTDDWVVSTALSSTWPAEGHVGCFGPWAWINLGPGTHDPSSSRSGLTVETLPYHWDSRQAFLKDAEYLAQLAERTIAALAEELNCRHRTSFSVRYWTIIIGWWVRIFTDVYFDRWTTMRLAAEKWPGRSLYTLTTPSSGWAEPSRDEFLRACLDDPWNERLWANLACTEFDVFDVHVLDSPGYSPFSLPPAQPSVSLRDTAHLSRHQQVALIDNYGPPRTRLRMDITLRQLPQYRALPEVPRVNESQSQRNWILDIGTSEFELSLGRALVLHLPTCYLEGFAAVGALAETTPWPRSPKVIATGTAHYTNETYSRWLAERTQGGAKFVVLQHGGFYGVGQKSSALDHDLSICDSFVTWGWSRDHAKPGPTPKLSGLKGTYNRNGDSLLYVLGSPYRYSNWLASQPLPPQHHVLIRRHVAFLERLDDQIQQVTHARVLESALGWRLTEYLRTQFPQLPSVGMSGPFARAVSDSRVVVCTDNSTTCIESMLMGAPTVLTWPTHLNELTDQGVELLYGLTEVGVFHPVPETAASHLAEIWDDPLAWWESKSVRAAVAAWLQAFGQPERRTHKALASYLKALRAPNSIQR